VFEFSMQICVVKFGGWMEFGRDVFGFDGRLSGKIQVLN